MTSRYNLGSLVRGAFWLYAVNLVDSLVGFAYWVLISRLTDPSTVGVVSAVIGLSSILYMVLCLGIPVSLQRFYGRALGIGDMHLVKLYFASALLYAIMVYGLSSTVLTVLALLHVSIGKFSPEMLLMIAFILLLQGASIAANPLVLSTLKTEVLLLATILGNLTKLVLGPCLVKLGLGWIGATIGYVMPTVAKLFATMSFSMRYVRPLAKPRLATLRDIVAAGLAVWIPSIINTLGMWLGVLTVYGFSTSYETGYYYIAYTMVSVIASAASCLLNLLLPYLSAIPDGRKRAAHNALRISLAMITPPIAALAVYSTIPLSLFGREYIKAAPLVTVLAPSAILIAITQCVISLTYAYARYREVLTIGLSSNIPRVAAYLILVPIYGSLGAALSYTIGSLTGTLYACHVASKTKFKLSYMTILKTTAIPTAIAIPLYFLCKVPWPIGLMLILASYVLYLRTTIITREDLALLLNSILPAQLATRLTRLLAPAANFLILEKHDKQSKSKEDKENVA